MAQTADGLAFAYLDSLVVIGSTSGVHEVIDTAKGGSPLSSSEQYATLADHAPDGALATVYRAGVSAPSALPAGLAELLDMVVGKPSAALTVVPTPSSLSLYADASGSTEGLLTGAQRSSQPSTHYPANLGLRPASAPGRPRSRQHSTTSARSSACCLEAATKAPAASASARCSKASRSRSRCSPAVRRPVTGRAPSAIFATGASPLEVRAGLTIDSTSTASSKAAIAKLGTELQAKGAKVEPKHVAGTEAALSLHLKGLPVEVVLATGRGREGTSKIVIGLGVESVQLALDPPNTMANAASARDARKALGGLSPTLVLEVPTLLAMLETIEATNEPTVAAVLPTSSA